MVPSFRRRRSMNRTSLFGSLVLGLAVCTPGFSFELLDRMLGYSGCGCDTSCCASSCCKSRCHGRNRCGCDNGCGKGVGCGCAAAAPGCGVAAPSCGVAAPTCAAAAPTCAGIAPTCGAAPACGCDNGCN